MNMKMKGNRKHRSRLVEEGEMCVRKRERIIRSNLELLYNICLLIFFQKYAMQQAFKTMMGQMNSQSNQFDSAAFSGGSPFPFPMPSPPASGPAAHASSAGTQFRAPSTPSASQSTVTVDIPATKVEAAPSTNVKDEGEVKNEPKKIGNLQSLLSTLLVPFLSCWMRLLVQFINDEYI